MLIHFDGWSINHDYWARPDGPYVHPVGWAAASKRRLIPPQDSQDTPATFTWAAHLAAQGARPVPAWAFKASATSRCPAQAGGTHPRPGTRQTSGWGRGWRRWTYTTPP